MTTMAEAIAQGRKLHKAKNADRNPTVEITIHGKEKDVRGELTYAGDDFIALVGPQGVEVFINLIHVEGLVFVP